MLTAALLCAALRLDSGLSRDESRRGCALAPAAVAAAQRVPGVDPAELLAIAWHESRWRVAATNGIYCGAWQISSRYGLSCAALRQPRVAALRAARLLAWFALHRPGSEPLAGYGGCRRGCPGFVRVVTERAARWNATVSGMVVDR